MESLQNYTNTTIHASNNNYIMIGESLLIEHGNEFNSIFSKIRRYNNVIKNRQFVNETAANNYDIQLTVSESDAATRYMTMVYEQLLANLNEELNLLENNLINEGILGDLVNGVQNAYHKAKDATVKAYNMVKAQIKEIAELLKKIATKAISSIKDMVLCVIKVLMALGCTISKFFNKLGWGNDINEDTWNELSQKFLDDKDENEIKKDAKDLVDYGQIGEALKTNNLLLLESLSVNILPNIITEDNDNNEHSDERVGKELVQGKAGSIAKTIKRILVDLVIQGVMCYGIPVIIQTICPYAMLVTIALYLCKILWSLYKIGPLVKQFKHVWKEWGNMSIWERILNVCSMLWSFYCMFANFNVLKADGGKLLEACKDMTWEMIKKQGSAIGSGLEPDAFMKALDVIIDNIKAGKLPWDNFANAYGVVTHLFEKNIPAEIKDAVINTGEVSAAKIIDKFNSDKYTNAGKYWAQVINPSSIKITDKLIQNAKDTDSVTVVLDGWASEANKRFRDLCQAWKEYHNSPLPVEEIAQGFNKVANAANAKQGSIFSIVMDAGFIKHCIKNKLEFGTGNAGTFSFAPDANGYMHNVAIMGVSNTVQEVISAGKSILKSMGMMLPFVHVESKNIGGFNVRLGSDNEKDKFLYSIPKDGTTIAKMSEAKEIIKKYNPEALEEINKQLHDRIASLNSVYMELVSQKESAKELKKIIDDLTEQIKKGENEVIIYYGKRVKEEQKDKDQSSENSQESNNNSGEEPKESLSLKSYNLLNGTTLCDYLITEGVTNQNILDNIKEIEDYLLNTRLKKSGKYVSKHDLDSDEYKATDDDSEQTKKDKEEKRKKHENENKDFDTLELFDKILKRGLSGDSVDSDIEKVANFLHDKLFTVKKDTLNADSKHASAISKDDIKNLLRLFNELSSEVRGSNLGKDAKKVEIQNQTSIAKIVYMLYNMYNDENSKDDDFLFKDAYSEYKKKFGEYINFDQCKFSDSEAKISLTDKAKNEKDNLQETLLNILTDFNKKLDTIKETEQKIANKDLEEKRKNFDKEKFKELEDTTNEFKDKIEKLKSKNLSKTTLACIDSLEKNFYGLQAAYIKYLAGDAKKNTIGLLKHDIKVIDGIKKVTLFKSAEFVESSRTYKNGSEDNNNDISADVKKMYITLVNILLKDPQFIKDLGKVNWCGKKVGDGGKQGHGKVNIIPMSEDDIKKATGEDSNPVKTKTGEVPVVAEPPKDLVPGKTQGKDSETENNDEPIDGGDDTGNTGDTDNDSNEPEDNDDGKEHPVLFWSTLLMVGGDLAKSDKKGPRDYLYSMRGMFDNTMHYIIKDGLNEHKLQIFLVKQVMKAGAAATANIVYPKPYSQSWKGKITDRFEVNTKGGYDENDCREDLSGFTNKEIVALLNENAKAEELLKGNAKTIQLARNPVEHKAVKRYKEETKTAIQKDKDIQQYIKDSDTLNKDGIISDDGKVDIEKANDLINVCGQTRFANTKKSSGKGFFSRLFNKFKAFFFGSDDDSSSNNYNEKEIQELNKRITELENKVNKKESKEETNNEESKNNDDNNVKESLQNYIDNKTSLSLFLYHKRNKLI